MSPRRLQGLAVTLAALLGALSAQSESTGSGASDNPSANDPTRWVDPRGISHLPVSRESPSRSPAGWLYAFPFSPTRTRPWVGPWKGALSLEWGGVWNTRRERETRYERFADRDDGLFLSGAWLTLEHTTKPLSIRGRALAARREDQAYALEGEYAGLWRIRGDFSRIRRHYATDARSLLSDAGSEIQRLRGGLTAGGNPQPAIDAVLANLRRETVSITR